MPAATRPATRRRSRKRPPAFRALIPLTRPPSMRLACTLLAAAFAIAGAAAQTDTVVTVRRLAEAKTLAAADGRDILAVFAGSDWCRPCKMFKRGVLDAPGFVDSAAAEVVVLYLDFPAKRRNALPAEQTAHNEALAERLNPGGSFPKLVLLRPDESTVAELEFVGQDAAAFLGELRAARASAGG